MDNIIEVKNITFKYDDDSQIQVAALDNVSLEIERGSFVAILGHNGSGKSTLAKHFNGLFVPDGGVVVVDGISTDNEEQIWQIRRTAGMVFQNPDNQMVATVVEEDVAFGLENIGVPSEEIRKRVDDALETVGMTKFAKSSPYHLSGGQKQRISIAGVLAMQPKVIVFDEVTAMLDPLGRRGIIETAKKLNRELGITIIIITHYMEESIDADMIYVMNDGKCVLKGKPREIFAETEFLISLGLTVPVATQIAYKLNKQGVNIPCNLLTMEELTEALCQLKQKI